DLRTIIAQVGAIPIDEVTREKTLSHDLMFDSLKRVDLLSTVEEDLGVYIDEARIDADTTVGELEDEVAAGSQAETRLDFAGWGRAPWARIIRGGLHRLLVFPLLGLFYRLKVSGRENLEGLAAPVLFAAN